MKRLVQSCAYVEARRGRLSGRCPACGEDARRHVRECERCGRDIPAAEVDACADGWHLYCDDCWEVRS